MPLFARKAFPLGKSRFSIEKHVFSPRKYHLSPKNHACSIRKYPISPEYQAFSPPKIPLAQVRAGAVRSQIRACAVLPPREFSLKKTLLPENHAFSTRKYQYFAWKSRIYTPKCHFSPRKASIFSSKILPPEHAFSP